MIHTAQADSRIRNLSLSALHLIAAETDCDVPYIIALLTEPRRGSGMLDNGAQTELDRGSDSSGTERAPIGVVEPGSSPAGSDPVAIPATHSPETAPRIHERASTNDEASPEAGPQAEASPAGTGTGTLADREARHDGEAASADLPTHSENAPDPAQAGDDTSTSPAPNQEPAPPPPMAVPASEPAGSDNAGEADPHVSPATKLTLFQRVSAAHAEHPDWTARQIADLIKHPVASVQTTLAVVRKAAAAPEPPQQPEPPPASAAEPRFYVLDQDGRYVHRRLTPTHTGSVVSMTDDRAMAWTPTEAQFGEAARRWPVLKSMRWRAVEKEAAR